MLVNFYSINCLIEVTHKYTNDNKETDYESIYSFEYLSEELKIEL